MKNNLLKILNDNYIMSRPTWKPLHKLNHLKNFPRMNLDICEDLYSRVINIPRGIEKNRKKDQVIIITPELEVLLNNILDIGRKFL